MNLLIAAERPFFSSRFNRVRIIDSCFNTSVHGVIPAQAGALTKPRIMAGWRFWLLVS